MCNKQVASPELLPFWIGHCYKQDAPTELLKSSE